MNVYKLFKMGKMSPWLHTSIIDEINKRTGKGNSGPTILTGFGIFLGLLPIFVIFFGFYLCALGIAHAVFGIFIIILGAALFYLGIIERPRLFRSIYEDFVEAIGEGNLVRALEIIQYLGKKQAREHPFIIDSLAYHFYQFLVAEKLPNDKGQNEEIITRARSVMKKHYHTLSLFCLTLKREDGQGEGWTPYIRRAKQLIPPPK